jgi:hypothetical protein
MVDQGDGIVFDLDVEFFGFRKDYSRNIKEIGA